MLLVHLIVYKVIIIDLRQVTPQETYMVLKCVSDKE
jgi:hypothetical protein